MGGITPDSPKREDFISKTNKNKKHMKKEIKLLIKCYESDIEELEEMDDDLEVTKEIEVLTRIIGDLKELLKPTH